MLVVGGQGEEPGGFRTVSWKELPEVRLSLPEDGRSRPPGTEVRSLLFHSTKGWPDHSRPDVRPELRPGKGPSGNAVKTFRYWSGHADRAGAALVLDSDGVLFQGADLLTEMSYNCPDANTFSIGLEIYQGPEGEYYQAQMDTFGALAEYVSGRFLIPRIVHYPYSGPVPGIGLLRGFYGHRDASSHRGAGDPGEFPYLRLLGAGFRPWDFRSYPPPDDGGTQYNQQRQ